MRQYRGRGFDGNGQGGVKDLDISSLVALEISGEGWYSALFQVNEEFTRAKYFKYIITVPQTENESQGVVSLDITERETEPRVLDRATWNVMVCVDMTNVSFISFLTKPKCFFTSVIHSESCRTSLLLSLYTPSLHSSGMHCRKVQLDRSRNFVSVF